MDHSLVRDSIENKGQTQDSNSTKVFSVVSQTNKISKNLDEEKGWVIVTTRKLKLRAPKNGT